VELIATSRGANKLAAVYPELTFEPMDVTSEEEVMQVVEKHKPTHLIHTAAMTNVDQCETDRENCWKQNVEAVANLIAACEAHDVHLIHVSTDFIFSGENGPYTENAVPGPVNFYGESKLAAEELVMEAECKWSIARTVLVYGIVHDYGRSNIVLWVKENLQAGKNIKVVDDQLRSPTLAEDLAQGCWLIARHDAQGVFNISGKELLTPYEMALRVADYFALDKSYIDKADASTFTQTAKRPPRTGFIITKAENELGYKPHSFTEGIALMEEQLKEMKA
ncbi:MAG: SDR family oxidoreductase, partial [Hymenobacteraceae bacterium]|nr:SDR family oxidoreductase [Hymenobacteraceae bacterium]